MELIFKLKKMQKAVDGRMKLGSGDSLIVQFSQIKSFLTGYARAIMFNGKVVDKTSKEPEHVSGIQITKMVEGQIT